MSYDLAKIRADFPILEERIHGHRLVYLDSGASAQKPNAVLDKMDWAHRHAYANVHRGLHTLANRATEAYENARLAVHKLLKSARPEEIIFTRSATEAINLVAASFGNARIGEAAVLVADPAQLLDAGARLEGRAPAAPDVVTFTFSPSFVSTPGVTPEAACDK